MKTATLKVVRIGNSKGVRLPASLLQRYRIGDEVSMETRRDGIVLRAANDKRLSWEDTFKAIAAEHRWHGNEFADMEGTAQDGLDTL